MMLHLLPDVTVSDDQKCKGMFIPWRLVSLLAMHCLGAFKNKDVESLLWSVTRMLQQNLCGGIWAADTKRKGGSSAWELNPDSGPRRS